MPPGLVALVVVLIAVIAGMGGLSLALWRHAKQLQARLDPAERGPAIEIGIDNPVELARNHSRWGGQLARVAPALITRRVYDLAAAEVREKLTDRGVQARVRVRRR